MTINAECAACGGDCSNANATYNGNVYHVGCLPVKKPKSRERFCWNCGNSLGVIEDRYYDRGDTCGNAECNREARNQAYAERDEAHEQLDRDMGWL